MSEIVAPACSRPRWQACRRISWDGAVAHLCGDPGPGSQLRHAALGNLFTLIAKIVRQLAVAIDLAAVDPGQPDQFRLAEVLMRTVA